jgi:hypothetical protein
MTDKEKLRMREEGKMNPLLQDCLVLLQKTFNIKISPKEASTNKLRIIVDKRGSEPTLFIKLTLTTDLKHYPGALVVEYIRTRPHEEDFEWEVSKSRGIGRQVMSVLEQAIKNSVWAKQNGYDRIVADSAFRESHGFYEKLGYEPISPTTSRDDSFIKVIK